MAGRREGGGGGTEVQYGREVKKKTESRNGKFTKEMSKQEATFLVHRAERIRIMGMSYLYFSF